jgi:NAD-dependent DNA ligase
MHPYIVYGFVIFSQIALAVFKVLEGLTKHGDMSVDEIADLLHVANDAYRNSDKTLMSDELYDVALTHLEQRAPNHPFLTLVGAPIKSNKVDLPYYMGSLNKIRDDEKSILKWMKEDPWDVVISDKLDGNSGMLVITPTSKTLYSRGDGVQGQNISKIIPYLHIPDTAVPPEGKTWAIRGELIISRANWEHIKHHGANARNVVAGCLNKKTPDPEIAERVDFVVYELVHPRMAPEEGLAFLKQQGFNVVYNVVMKDTDLLGSNGPVNTLSEILMRRRQESSYDVDGIVVYQNKPHNIANGKNPSCAFAYKSIHMHDEVEVVVSEVEWNVSKDGYIKPTVKFDPVLLGGVSICRATGFNASFIDKHTIMSF